MSHRNFGFEAAELSRSRSAIAFFLCCAIGLAALFGFTYFAMTLILDLPSIP